MGEFPQLLHVSYKFTAHLCKKTLPFGNTVNLWKAADLTPLGSLFTGSGNFPQGTCSDGLNFWIPLPGTGKVARF